MLNEMMQRNFDRELFEAINDFENELFAIETGLDPNEEIFHEKNIVEYPNEEKFMEWQKENSRKLEKLFEPIEDKISQQYGYKNYEEYLNEHFEIY